jgi:DNA-3-methyladenine glycosylase II
MWGRRPGFDTLLRILLEQQVSLVSARSMYNRLRANIDPFDAMTFIDRGEESLRTLGMTRQKAHYAMHIAEGFISGSLKDIGRMNDEAAYAKLTEIKGVGPWTANIYLLMALRRPDIWPDGDLALASSIAQLRKMPTRPSVDKLARIANRWRPYRSVAARMLWQYYLAQRSSHR